MNSDSENLDEDINSDIIAPINKPIEYKQNDRIYKGEIHITKSGKKNLKYRRNGIVYYKSIQEYIPYTKPVIEEPLVPEFLDEVKSCLRTKTKIPDIAESLDISVYRLKKILKEYKEFFDS